MVTRIIVSVVAVLALSAGVAYAATELTSSDGTDVCVNSTNGLMRVASTCREGEYPLTIGGGGDVQVTQNGTFTVQRDQTAGRTLPLTGITVTGRCDYWSGGGGEGLLPQVQLRAAAGESLDAFGTSATEVIQGDSILIGPLGAVSSTPPYTHGSGWTTAIATSKDATATVTVGGSGDWGDQMCTFLWQAVEAAN